jgi:hypothetical protein
VLTADSTVSWTWEVEYEVSAASVPAGGGSVSLTPGGPWVRAGSALEASASASGGYEFFGWRGDASGSENPWTGTADGPKRVEGCFLGSRGLGVSAGPCNPVSGRESGTGSNVPMMQVRMKAGSGEGVSVGWVRVSVSGTSDESATVSGVEVWWDKDGDGVVDAGTDVSLSSGVTFGANDGSVMMTLSPALTVPAGGEAYALVTFDWSAGAGTTFRARVSGNGDVGAIGTVSATASEVVGAPVQGGEKTVAGGGTPGTLELYRGLKTPAGREVRAGETGIGAMQWLVRASGVEGLTVTSVVLTGFGSGDDLGVGEVRLYRDDNEDGSWDAGDTLLGTWGTYGSDDGTVSFTGLTEYLAAGTQEAWLVVYDMGAGAESGTYGAKVAKAADVWAVGSTTMGGAQVSGAPVSGNEMWVRGTGGEGEYAGFAGGCGAGAGGAPVWPLLPLAAALWSLLAARRRNQGSGDHRSQKRQL